MPANVPVQTPLGGEPEALKKYFGYTSFRPYQAETIEAVRSGRDAFLLMPTGGGKSLCYQLPAVLASGITLVVSPLIALMKDQVDQMNAVGIPATFLNSSLEPGEASDRTRAIESGKIKLLYVAPERLNTSGFSLLLDRLQENPEIGISLIAIDEAHCISEWGHDFRADYRLLGTLKKRWPRVPIIAMTATATKRVEEDIIQQLGLRNAFRAEVSFNRPNLYYSVQKKDDGFHQLLEFLKNHKKQSGIVYCFSQKSAESLAAALVQAGIRALPYHAGMDRTLRTKNQDRFSRDEAEVVCATIAFGMGINKSNVRFVVHYDLPKHIAGYYQETGRAGRDGLPADCLLLFSLGDKSKQLRFIDEKESPEERKRATDELDQMVAFAQTWSCRRAQLLSYFGETFTEIPCGACDNCLKPKVAAYDATTEAKKFLSCVVRVGERFGVKHVVDVLRGSESDKILQFRHQNLSTYGIGKEYSVAQWQSVANELLRLGLVWRDENSYSALKVTKAGWAVLKDGQPVMLETKPLNTRDRRAKQTSAGTASTSASNAIGLPEYNEQLFDRLREIRKRIADHENVPAYVIFHDTALRQMAALLPLDQRALLKVAGVGEVKARKYGNEMISVIRDFVTENPAVSEVTLSLATLPREVAPVGSAYLARDYILSGLTIEQAAVERKIAPSTLSNHLAQLISAGDKELFYKLVPDERHQTIVEAYNTVGWHALRPVLEHLQSTVTLPPFTYDELRFVRAFEQFQYWESEKASSV